MIDIWYYNCCLQSIPCYSACQLKIGGEAGFDCTSCAVNGPGKCDPDGCPKHAWFDGSDNKCAGIKLITFLITPPSI